ncbi:MAG: imidazole glycerol phosphate synthase subunit HisH [Longimicrobiales bacterium]
MRVALFDYGAGNVHTLAKALELGGARIVLEPDATSLLDADALVLPGTGRFAAGARRLGPGGHAVRVALAAGFPCLAIGIGMHLLFEGSDDGDEHGVGFFEGRVRPLRARRVPHIGWNQVQTAADPLFRGVVPLTAYFAHGHAVEPDAVSTQVIGWAMHESDGFPAAVRKVNAWGVQFHPEKSGVPGLQLVRNFIEAAARSVLGADPYSAQSGL